LKSAQIKANQLLGLEILSEVYMLCFGARAWSSREV